MLRSDAEKFDHLHFLDDEGNWDKSEVMDVLQTLLDEFGDSGEAQVELSRTSYAKYEISESSFIDYICWAHEVFTLLNQKIWRGEISEVFTLLRQFKSRNELVVNFFSLVMLTYQFFNMESVGAVLSVRKEIKDVLDHGDFDECMFAFYSGYASAKNASHQELVNMLNAATAEKNNPLIQRLISIGFLKEQSSSHR